MTNQPPDDAAEQRDPSPPPAPADSEEALKKEGERAQEEAAHDRETQQGYQ